MPIQTFTKWFAVEDAKMALVDSDVEGAATTYQSLIDVPGVKSAKLTGTVEVKELRGDNALLDKDAILKDLKVTVEHAKIGFDLLPAFGFTVASSGTTPNEKLTASLDGLTSVRPAPFKFEAKTPTGGVDLIGGDGHMVLYKCTAAAFPAIGFTEEDYTIVSFEADAFPCLGTGKKWIDLVLNETAAAIA